ncbi:MAG: FAD-dependent monooxygenase [Pseudomonadota bacterium]
MKPEYDIFISGAGIAGLAAAAVFGASGHRVLIVDPAPPETSESDPAADLRTTAFLQPARGIMERAGIWDALAPHTTPLRTLRVIDCSGARPTARTRRDFEAGDISEAPFGWNIPNWRSRSILADTLSSMERVDLRLGTGFAALHLRDDIARIRLSDGSSIAARLCLAADGRGSPVRSAMGIGTKTTRYGQKALAFAVTHEIPHDEVSTEIYHRGGAFTLVPLPDYDNRPSSAVVWMEDARAAMELTDLPEDAFNDRATERSTGVLGPLRKVGGVRTWPIITQVADRLTQPRAALLAEAAHVMPPIGAQGLNTSLQDVRALADAIEAHPGDPGAPAVLAAYARARQGDIRARAAVIDVYNRICRSGAPPIQALRSAGLRLVHDIAPLRRTIMGAGLGRL